MIELYQIRKMIFAPNILVFNLEKKLRLSKYFQILLLTYYIL